MERSEKIHLARLIVLAGFIFSVTFHYFEGGYGNAPYPLNTFLFTPSARFNDFIFPYTIASDPYDLNKDVMASFPYIEANSGVFSGSLVSGSGGGPLYFPVAYRFVSLFSLFPTGVAFFLFLVILLSCSLLIFFK